VYGANVSEMDLGKEFLPHRKRSRPMSVREVVRVIAYAGIISTSDASADDLSGKKTS